MKEIEVEGKSVTQAVEKGLSEMGLRRDQVEVQVLQEAAPGFLGMGAKTARVRIREKIWGEGQGGVDEPAAPQERKPAASHEHGSRAPEPHRAAHHRPPAALPGRHHRMKEAGRRPLPTAAHAPSPKREPAPPPPDTAQACAQAKALVEEVLGVMKISSSSVAASWDADQTRVLIQVETPDSEALIGPEGRALESLQYIVTLMLSRRMKTPVAVQIETGGYWKEKEESIILQVHQAIEMVNRTSSAVRLKPMDACMRRLVHRTLAKHPDIETVSEGEGMWRKVVLKPKRK